MDPPCIAEAAFLPLFFLAFVSPFRAIGLENSRSVLLLLWRWPPPRTEAASE